MREAQAKCDAGDPNWWLLREAAVYALGSVMGDMCRLENFPQLFNLAAFFDGIVLNDVSNRNVPVMSLPLRPRARVY